MNIPLDADNLDVRLTDDGQVVAETSYIKYLRENGYPIDAVSDAEVVDRPSSDSDTGHLVVKIQTLTKPTSHPDSDAVADQIELPVCDCWAYRQSTPDVGEGETLENGMPSCPHITEAYREERARKDDQQTEL